MSSHFVDFDDNDPTPPPKKGPDTLLPQVTTLEARYPGLFYRGNPCRTDTMERSVATFAGFQLSNDVPLYEFYPFRVDWDVARQLGLTTIRCYEEGVMTDGVKYARSVVVHSSNIRKMYLNAARHENMSNLLGIQTELGVTVGPSASHVEVVMETRDLLESKNWCHTSNLGFAYLRALQNRVVADAFPGRFHALSGDELQAIGIPGPATITVCSARRSSTGANRLVAVFVTETAYDLAEMDSATQDAHNREVQECDVVLRVSNLASGLTTAGSGRQFFIDEPVFKRVSASA